MKVRTRYAPSPTGLMHIGNLRTALYEYLIAKSNNGEFILRIEDTDQGRLVDGAVDVIYRTLDKVGLKADEGPNIGGEYGPYIQSERIDDYSKYAHKLVEMGKAYYCFCSKERLDSLRDGNEKAKNSMLGYDRHCRDLPKEEVQRLLKEKTPYVIRQKIPLEGKSVFTDAVFGEIAIENKEIEDQVLLKADGYPTYNFANVIDDHLMNITHVVRGSEYLTSTPKYNLLYEAFGWEVPTYIHLPLIMGEDENGNISKLSKRHGATSFEDLINEGYLPEAIVNYIALLGWCPDNNQEMFTLSELEKNFSVDRISKSPSVFDYEKLKWFNGEYIKKLTDEKFLSMALPYLKKVLNDDDFNLNVLASILKTRISKLTDIPDMIGFLKECPDYDVDLFVNKKSKTNLENSLFVLEKAVHLLKNINEWSHDELYSGLVDMANELELKNGTVMWPVRIAVAGQKVTPGGAVEILQILGKNESLNRIKTAISKLKNHQGNV